ncbi:MAG: NAD(P)/FAD-dependent oxidoreductase [Spirochaetia bacterium]|nr:NAD(P)/FAD-dependent oxidoreductase [Spirochaetia bacterium]
MKKIKIVILGGGYAGVHAGKKLHKKFKKLKDRVEVTLIDKKPYHTLMTELHEVAGGRVGEESVKISFDRIFSGKMVNVIQDEINDIDFNNQKLVSSDNSYEYDYLLISTGAEASDFGIPGIKEHSFPLWGLEDALAIREHVEDVVRRAALEKDDQKRKEMLTFVVAGAGFTGIEMMGELVEWLPILCKKHHVDIDEVSLKTVEGLGKILNTWPEKPRKKVEKYLRRKGVDLHLNSFITKAEKDKLELKDGTVIKTDTIIWTCGIKGSSFGENLDLEEGKMARKKVDAYMKSPNYDNVYLAGDQVWFLEEERPLPQIVEAAEQTASVAVDGITYKAKGELGYDVKEPKPFSSNFHGYMVSIGGKYGVSYTMGFSLSGFFALALKHLINIYYQHTVCGINGWWRYIQHEILNIKNKRSLIGGLASFKVQSYWTTFLRMFLGAMWFIEGIKKVLDGWLADKTGGYVYWGSSAEGADDTAAASAAEWGEGAAETAEAAGEAVQQFAPPLLDNPTLLFQWVNETFVAQAPYFFQVMIVVGEIILGLCFLGGLFTFPAAVASIGLSVMLLIGAMAGQEILWYIAVSIVMLGGAGRAFGLDYWVMPWIKKIWNSTRLAHKTYLYLDEPVLKWKKRK